MPLIDRVRQTIRQHDLARPDTRVVVALSGGSDSVALAYCLRALDAAGELCAVGLAHFNHQLRSAALGDERFSAGVALSLGWPMLIEREDVAGRARRDRRSIEGAARTARHDFFERARRHFNADVVAVGHTRDDQAETFLLRLLRGAGPRGLAAMHPRHGAIVRPLLDCRRHELRAYLESQQIAYVHDESNDDVSIPRNRVRAELLPFLERRFNPSIVDVLADEAELAREEWRWMDAAAEELSARLCRADGRVWRLDVSGLNQAPPALRRLVLWSAMTRAAAGRAISFDHVQAALRLTGGDGAGAIDAPGHRLARVGADLVLTSRPAGTVGRPAAASANLFQYPLSIPGEVQVSEARCVVSVEALPPGASAPDPGATAGNGEAAIVRRDLCAGGLAVRNRRPGDRFRPVGLAGRKKLQDFFVDRKIARERRESVPIVVDGTDRIVWVAGHAIDDQFRVTDPAQAMLILRLKVLGGPR